MKELLNKTLENIVSGNLEEAKNAYSTYLTLKSKELLESMEKVQESDEMDKGAFHRWLGKDEDQPITDADIKKGLASDDAHVRKMAQFAKNMKKARK